MPWTVQPSNYSNIQQAIYTIATTGSTLTFPAGKIGEFPTEQQLTDAQNSPSGAYPYFAIRQADFMGFATGTELQGSADAGQRGIGVTEPVWDFPCYAIYQYTEEVPNFDLAATAMVTLTVTLEEQIYLPLNGTNTCALSNTHSWGVQNITLGQTMLTVAQLKVRAYEMLSASYT